MPKIAMQMTPSEWKRYRHSNGTAKEAPERSEISRGSRKKALQTARQAANILRERFGAQKVVVFGSLATDIGFTEFSDIDLAAWGIPSDAYYKAVAMVTGLSERYKIDLIDSELCRDSIKKAILEQGVEL